jgi:hypothetical protein
MKRVAFALSTLALLLFAWVVYDGVFVNAPDDEYASFCSENPCHDFFGKACFATTNCCKNSHDWATEIRDGTVCKGMARVRVELGLDERDRRAIELWKSFRKKEILSDCVDDGPGLPPNARICE